MLCSRLPTNRPYFGQKNPNKEIGKNVRFIIKAVINNIFVSCHPTDRSFFSKNPHIFKSGGRKNYRNPLFCRYVILTHGISKMAAANEHDMTMNFMLSQRIFLLLQAQSHANSLADAYSLGHGALIELIKK